MEIYGKEGIPYRRHGGFALSPQNYPSAVNGKYLPSCMLHPGQIYVHDMTYKFGVLSKDWSLFHLDLSFNTWFSLYI